MTGSMEQTKSYKKELQQPSHPHASTSETKDEENQFTDKGYAWIVAFSSFFLNILLASFFCVYGVIYLELVEYFGTSKSVASWIGAIQQLLYGLTGLLIGPLVRIYGVRKAGIAAPFLVAIGYVCTPFCSQIWTFAITFVLTGIGYGCFAVCSVAAVVPWFSKRISLAISITMLGISIGTFIWPPLVIWLIKMYSWKGAMIICGGTQLQAVVFLALFRPTDVQTKWRGTCIREVEESTLQKSLSNSTEKSESKIQEYNKKHFLSWIILFKDWSFPITFLGLFLSHMGYISTFTYTTARGILLGYPETEAALLSSMVGAGGILGRFLAGPLGNTFGNKRIYACAFFMCTLGITSVVSILSAHYWYLASYCTIWGVFCGFQVVYMTSGLIDIYGTGYSAEVIGFNFACGGVSFLLTNIFTGILLDKSSNPSLPSAVFGSLQCLGGVIVFASVFIKEKRLNKVSKAPNEIYR